MWAAEAASRTTGAISSPGSRAWRHWQTHHFETPKTGFVLVGAREFVERDLEIESKAIWWSWRW